jgi:hypothetical protein
MNYTIHRDSSVTDEAGDSVGYCYTGDYGLAYVGFYDGAPSGVHSFHVSVGDWLLP